MNELIKVTEKNGEQLVSAKELHEFLEVKSKFADWFKNRVSKYGFEENQDYVSISKNLEKSRREIDYVLKLDIAKELSMVEGNEKGSQARKYFIELEKAWNSPDKIMARALQIAQKEIENYKKEIEYQKPKVEFYDQIIDSKDTIDIGSLAKTLNIRNIGRNKLFEILRERKILDSKNQPYQTYIDRGYFRTIETSYIQGGDVKIHIKTVVFQKGVDYISKMLKTD